LIANHSTILDLTLSSNNDFKIGDNIIIYHMTNIPILNTWKIINHTNENFTIQNIDANEGVIKIHNEDAIIKKCPIGGGAIWIKEYLDNMVSYSCFIENTIFKKLIIDDSFISYAKVFLNNEENNQLSEPLYILKNSNYFNSSIKWRIIGDNKRFYLFLTSKQNTVSHTNIIIFGEIKDIFWDEWDVILIAYDNELQTNCGFNLAFSYPKWTILSTGHLLCESIITSPKSDATWQTQNINLIFRNLTDFNDAGHHIYPVFIPHILYNP